jgi:hypothetical protein
MRILEEVVGSGEWLVASGTVADFDGVFLNTEIAEGAARRQRKKELGDRGWLGVTIMGDDSREVDYC